MNLTALDMKTNVLNVHSLDYWNHFSTNLLIFLENFQPYAILNVF